MYIWDSNFVVFGIGGSEGARGDLHTTNIIVNIVQNLILVTNFLLSVSIHEILVECLYRVYVIFGTWNKTRRSEMQGTGAGLGECVSILSSHTIARPPLSKSSSWHYANTSVV